MEQDQIATLDKLLNETHNIWVRTDKGKEFIAFVWSRDIASGINRAITEGQRFGHKILKAWAEPAAFF